MRSRIIKKCIWHHEHEHRRDTNKSAKLHREYRRFHIRAIENRSVRRGFLRATIEASTYSDKSKHRRHHKPSKYNLHICPVSPSLFPGPTTTPTASEHGLNTPAPSPKPEAKLSRSHLQHLRDRSPISPPPATLSFSPAAGPTSIRLAMANLASPSATPPIR